jgi:hypothetical protein
MINKDENFSAIHLGNKYLLAGVSINGMSKCAKKTLLIRARVHTWLCFLPEEEQKAFLSLTPLALVAIGNFSSEKKGYVCYE